MVSDQMVELCRDLEDETAVLEKMVAPLGPEGWGRPTPAQGWSIGDQIGHLARFDDAATLSVTDPTAFREEVARMAARREGFVDSEVEAARNLSGPEVLAWWRRARRTLLGAMTDADPRARHPWYGPDMSGASLVTARFMETWAHGQDVADALDITRSPTRRLRHVAFLGHRALPFSFEVNGLEAPAGGVRVELSGPSGECWTYGAPGSDGLVRGDALEFCLVVTQRRHVDDTGLEVRGDVARSWMSIAQAYAGPPGPGREPGRPLSSQT